MSEGSHRSSPAGAGSSGLAVVTPHAVVILPDGAPAGVVEDLWRTLADPAVAAEAIVAALPLRGPDGVASFAVLVHEPGGPDGARLQVVLRGDAVIDADIAGSADPRRVDARQAQPFYLATLDRVRAYRAGRAGAGA
ncbi:FHA domain-containing protein, partial [Clavibacter lycopersici]